MAIASYVKALCAAKPAWLRTRAMRVGEPWDDDRTDRFSFEFWTRPSYDNGKVDTRSSYNLEDAATEIQIQGLELDWTCVAWRWGQRFGDSG